MDVWVVATVVAAAVDGAADNYHNVSVLILPIRPRMNAATIVTTMVVTAGNIGGRG